MSLTKPLSGKAFSAVTELFFRVSGIRLGAGKEALVAGRLQRLAHEAGENDLERYVDHLISGGAPAAEMEKVIDRLTTNETYFFREPPHFQDLAQLAAEMPTDRELRVWSAASSSGEEAYSAAMILADVRGDAPWQVIGTDLSATMVESAKRALFTLERARMVRPEYLERYCLKGRGEYEGSLLISRPIRQRVSFQQANLMQPLPDNLPMFDVIFLRNVLIYFDNPSKVQIIQRVLTKLRPEGVLYTGHAESLNTLSLPLRTLGTAIHGHA
jgi:chemotaxis protein methyltransferase CheR